MAQNSFRSQLTIFISDFLYFNQNQGNAGVFGNAIFSYIYMDELKQ